MFATKLFFLLLMGILLTACGSPAAAESAPGLAAATAMDDVHVDIRLFGFQDQEITVPAGTRVTWMNHDNIEHSVTSGTPENPDGVFDSDFFTQDETFSMVFNQPGEYQYFCRRHNHMTGTVIVIP
jgi:plastocyanin